MLLQKYSHDVTDIYSLDYIYSAPDKPQADLFLSNSVSDDIVQTCEEYSISIFRDPDHNILRIAQRVEE